MIKFTNGVYHLTTRNTGYAFKVTEHGDLQHLYFGRKVSDSDLNNLARRRELLLINTLYTDDDVSYGIDDTDFEYSFAFRGDSRSCAACMNTADGSVFDFVFGGARIDAEAPDTGMPVPGGYDGSLCVTLIDRLHDGLSAELWYLTYADNDVISRFVRLVNNSGNNIVVNKLMSAQYDLRTDNPQLISFHGAWGRERMLNRQNLTAGKLTCGSYSGMSSAECNPFCMLTSESTSLDNGGAYGFNLIYSASHEIGAEVTPYGGVRITQGIESEGFAYRLEDREIFDTPLSAASYSQLGLNGVSANMQNFVRSKVTPKKTVPVMLNSWEAMYFDLNCDKLKRFADKAYELGFEGVVIDDGWFGKRNDDTTSLGDWIENREKFPDGIIEISRYLRLKGMKLGIWIEPEMISEKSALYSSHPEWVLRHAGARQIVGRGQYILDLTQEAVQDYICDTFGRVVSLYGAEYIKWDFNRRFSDVFGAEGSAYYYRYVKGLYRVLKRIGVDYPNVVIENCASGGGRFDLGMLSYCPVGWVSDNTDPLSRAEIQDGTSYGYPISVMLNHVTAANGHQTGRASNLKARKDTAYIGAFGAQWDVTGIDGGDSALLAAAVAEYKSERDALVNSTLYHLPCGDNYVMWQIMSEGKNCGWVYLMQKRFYTGVELPRLKLFGLDALTQYKVYGGNVNFVLSGAELTGTGVILPQNYNSEYPGILSLTDVSTLLLRIERIGGK